MLPVVTFSCIVDCRIYANENHGFYPYAEKKNDIISREKTERYVHILSYYYNQAHSFESRNLCRTMKQHNMFLLATNSTYTDEENEQCPSRASGTVNGSDRTETFILTALITN